MLVNNYIPRISIVTGIVNSRDAVSETVIADMEALDKLSRQSRRNVDLRVFCMESDHADARIRVLSNWRDALSDEHFTTSDIYYFHYAIYNDIHHLMYHLRRDAKSVVFFHNVTPPQFCAPQAEALIHASYQQIRNFRTADLILAPSDYSARQLAEYGLAKDIRVVPLFGPNGPERVAPSPRSPHEGPLRLLYCGRFVPSKGVESLLVALDAISARLARPVELTLAGNSQFSDKQYLCELREMGERISGQASVRFAFNLDADTLKALFAEADAFVLPSFHEGFGMPVAEALMTGTPVICSNAGALPEVGGGSALTFPAGDAVILGKALLEFTKAWSEGKVLCDHGVLPHAEWDKERVAHAATFLRASYIDRIGAEFKSLLQPTASWSADARQALTDAQLFTSHNHPPNPLDSAIKGDLLARRVLRAIEDGRTAMRRLLSLPFSWPQSDEDLTYWFGVVAERGVSGLVKHLVNSNELRQSPERLQASVFFRAQLVAGDIDGMLTKKARKERLEANDYARAKLRLLAGNRKQSDSEFLREALSLLGRDDADNARIDDLSEKLASGAISRAEAAELLGSMSSSDDAREKEAQSGYAIPASWRSQASVQHPADVATDNRWEGSSARRVGVSPEIAQLMSDLRYASLEAEALKRRLASRRASEILFWRPLRGARHFASLASGVIGPARRFIGQGNEARDRRDWEAAARNYALAVQVSPRLGHIWIQLGHARKEMKMLLEAKSAYQHALELMPFDSDAHLQMGHLHSILGDEDAMIDCYWKSLFYDPDNVHAIQELRGHGLADDVDRIRSRMRSAR